MPTQNNVNTFDTQGRTLIQRPERIKPWAESAGTKNKGSVWISMKPYKILDQFSKGAGAISSTTVPEEFLFLAPLSLNETISHHWEAYESVASRLAQKVRSAVKLTSEVTGLVETFGKGSNLGTITDNVKQIVSSSSRAGVAVEKLSKQIYNSVGGHSIPKIKIDTPLYYTNSDRRQLILEFQLFQETNSKQSLIEPVQKLMKYSSPDNLGGIDIEFPYMFEVKTVPEEFIKYSTCALTGVQPTWNSPYIQGVPSSCNLTLTFTDLSPLYRDTIEKGTIINVISPNEANALKARGESTTIKNFNPTMRTGYSREELNRLR